jgi:hypothetical protein
VEFDKQEIIEALRGRGEDELADRVEAELPPTVDTEDHRDELRSLGINPADLIGGIAGTFG